MRMKEPSVSRYPLEIHCCAASPPPRLRSIAGSATLTTELSTVTTLEPRIAAMRTRRCCRVMSPASVTDGLRRSFGERERWRARGSGCWRSLRCRRCDQPSTPKSTSCVEDRLRMVSRKTNRHSTDTCQISALADLALPPDSARPGDIESPAPTATAKARDDTIIRLSGPADRTIGGSSRDPAQSGNPAGMSPISRGFHPRRPEVDPGRVPPGQYVVNDFPVLSAGPTPHTPLDEWTFR